MSESIPDGCKHLYGSLFLVPFALIRTPEADDSEGYSFTNPRLLTESGQADILDKKCSAELRESIKHRTLLNPPVCRWVDDGETCYPQLVGGERRYRALDFLIRKKEIVTDPRSARLNDEGQWEYTQCSAQEAYEFIPCQVFSCNTDLDALALSWAENKGRINLSEGHEVAEVIKLRKFEATDERILEILQRDEKWLQETDSLITNLDKNTLEDLLEGRLNRASAIELSWINNLELRNKVREIANEAAKEASDRKIHRFQKQVESALEQKEIAEGSVADAEFREDEAGIAEAQDAIIEADKKITRTVKERDAIVPITRAVDVKRAKATVEGRVDIDRPIKILSAKKIMQGIDYLDTLIENEGECPEGTFAIDVNQLKLVRNIINNNILANEPDFAATISRFSANDEEIDEEEIDEEEIDEEEIDDK